VRHNKVEKTHTSSEAQEKRKREEWKKNQPLSEQLTPFTILIIMILMINR
jgi:hypothetical protein